METDTALVWSYCRVELNPVTGICLHLTIVVNPCNLECKDTLWLYDALYYLCIFKLWVLVVNFFN